MRNCRKCVITGMVAVACAWVAAQETDSPLPETPASEGITLREAVSRVLEHNPTLAAASWEVRAAEARIVQAGVRPNPELSLEIEDWRFGDASGSRSRTFSIDTSGAAGFERERENGGDGGLSNAEVTLSLAQVVELGGKRARRIGLAERERDLVQWDFEALRLDVLTRAHKAFIDVVEAQERLRLAEEGRGVAEQVLGTVSARVEAGKVSPLEATRAETELATARIAQDRAVRLLEGARTRLAALWAAPRPDFERAAGDLRDVEEPPSFEAVIQWVERNPDVARWADEMSAREAVLALERAQRIPDVTIEAGFRTQGVSGGDVSRWSVDTAGTLGAAWSEVEPDSERENSVVLAVAVPLPIFDRNQGSIAEAEHRAAQAADRRREAEVTAKAALHEAYQGLSQAHAAVHAFEDNVLPRARDTFERTGEGYREGKFGYLDVLTAQQTLLEVQARYLDALTEYHQARADAERLVGEPLPHVLGDEPSLQPGGKSNE